MNYLDTIFEEMEFHKNKMDFFEGKLVRGEEVELTDYFKRCFNYHKECWEEWNKDLKRYERGFNLKDNSIFKW